MRQFEDLLRQGLMDANLAQYESVLRRADIREPDFSPRYLRERMRLLADPWGWAKRRPERGGVRRSGRRLARNIACVLLACTVAFGALMAASPAVRAAVEKWLRQITQVEDQVIVKYYPSEPDETVVQSSWRPAGMPEGWVLRDLIRVADGVTYWSFQKAGGESNESIDFHWFSSATEGNSYGTDEKDWGFQAKTTVHGQPADYFEGESSALLAWTEEDGSLLILSTYHVKDRAMLERIAESASPWTGSPVEYQAGWVPEGHEERRTSGSSSVGLGHLRWTEHYTILSLQYVNDPICPFETPSRTPEAVTVNGLPGLYWPSLVPIEEKGAGVSGDPAYSPAMSYAIEESAVLTWEDPETNTSFRISGILEREDILRMAESVTKKTS